jgi:hypothetical protein
MVRAAASDTENEQQRCEPDLITVVSLHDPHPSGRDLEPVESVEGDRVLFLLDSGLRHPIIVSAAHNPHKPSSGSYTFVGIGADLEAIRIHSYGWVAVGNSSGMAIEQNSAISAKERASSVRFPQCVRLPSFSQKRKSA